MQLSGKGNYLYFPAASLHKYSDIWLVYYTGRLQVLGPRRPGHERQGFAQALLLAEAALVPDGPNMAHTG